MGVLKVRPPWECGDEASIAWEMRPAGSLGHIDVFPFLLQGDSKGSKDGLLVVPPHRARVFNNDVYVQVWPEILHTACDHRHNVE